LAKKGLKIKKVSNLGVDVIQPRGRSFLRASSCYPNPLLTYSSSAVVYFLFGSIRCVLCSEC